ncbi:17125_t:CDS:1, partial [Cetraspora pellucida]
VHHINQTILDLLSGHQHTYIRADSAIVEKGADNNDDIYPVEFLNTLNPNGLPLAKLIVKINCPIMLLRNIAPGQGLCNGTHLIITNLTNRIIEARILSGDHTGELTFIP